jgi:hypothetical protein
MKKAIKYIIISAVVLALQAVLIRLGKVGFGFGAAIACAYSLTLNLNKKTPVSAVFTALALLIDCVTMPFQHIGIYGFILFSVALSFVLVWLTTKHEYGLLLSDALGVLSGYVPAYLLIKYIGQYFVEPQDDYLYLTELSHYPLMIGCVAGGIIAFLAVPAVRVLSRYAEEKEQN